MKNVFAFSILLLLISCGGGNNSVNPNDIKLQIFQRTDYQPTTGTPLKDIVVQLDHDGVNIKTDEQGFVTFSALGNGKHDIHVFSSNYQWQSIYNVDIGELVKIYLDPKDTTAATAIPSTNTSYISFSGNVSKTSPDNDIIFEFYSNGIKSNFISPSVTSTTSYNIDLEFSAPAGTVITGDILVIEEQWNQSINEFFVVNKTTIPVTLLKTQTTTAVYNNYDITFSNSTVEDLLSFDSINIPDGYTVENIQINSSVSKKDESILNPWITLYYIDNFENSLPFKLTDTKTYQAYDPFNFSELSFRVSAKQGINRNMRWRYVTRYPIETNR